jgi:hypothetical protein
MGQLSPKKVLDDARPRRASLHPAPDGKTLRVTTRNKGISNRAGVAEVYLL